jgi:hypothetical protein
MTSNKVFKNAAMLMAALKIPAMKRPKTPGKFSAKAIT